MSGADSRRYVCGGKLTPEAEAELEEFAGHLREHSTKGIVQPDCRFCAKRAVSHGPSPESEPKDVNR